MENFSSFELSQISIFLSLSDIGSLASINKHTYHQITKSPNFWQQVQTKFPGNLTGIGDYRRYCYDRTILALHLFRLITPKFTTLVPGIQSPKNFINSKNRELRDVYYWTDKYGNFFRKKKSVNLNRSFIQLACGQNIGYGLDDQGYLWKIGPSGFTQLILETSESPGANVALEASESSRSFGTNVSLKSSESPFPKIHINSVRKLPSIKISWIGVSQRDLIVGTKKFQVWFQGENQFNLISRWHQPMKKLKHIPFNFPVINAQIGQFTSLLQDNSGKVWDVRHGFVNFDHPIIATSVGQFHGLLLDNQGVVYGFGQNQYHQYGSDVNFSFYPIKISGLPRIVSIAAGFYYSAFIDENTQVWVTGTDFRQFNYLVPTRLPQFFFVHSLSPGYNGLLILGQAIQTQKHYLKCKDRGEIQEIQEILEYEKFVAPHHQMIRYVLTNGEVEFTEIPKTQE